ncbi:MAG: hypothetical protein AAFO07_09275 [Bacteroidota bacterium]
MKYIIAGIIIYFLYKRFFTTPSLNKGRGEKDQADDRSNNYSKDNNQGEFIDYEEVD